MKKICVITSIILCLLLITINVFVITGGADNNDTVVITLSFFGPRWDIDGNGICNTYDVSTLVGDYGATGSPEWIRSDIDGDGAVSTYDVSILVGHYGGSWLS